jgi:hypothetical protein
MGRRTFLINGGSEFCYHRLRQATKYRIGLHRVVYKAWAMKLVFVLVVLVLVLICVPVIGVLYWRARNRAFRAEVVVETLRLWRGLVEDYREKNPPDRITEGMSVPEEAAYMATDGPVRVRKKVMAIAWANVKKMTKYHVQECKMGKAVGGWHEIYANSEQDAARKVVRGNLRPKGKLGELRVRVRLASDPKQEADFYADN